VTKQAFRSDPEKNKHCRFGKEWVWADDPNAMPSEQSSCSHARRMRASCSMGCSYLCCAYLEWGRMLRCRICCAFLNSLLSLRCAGLGCRRGTEEMLCARSAAHLATRRRTRCYVACLAGVPLGLLPPTFILCTSVHLSSRRCAHSAAVSGLTCMSVHCVRAASRSELND
jgi:hypothetical protein